MLVACAAAAAAVALPAVPAEAAPSGKAVFQQLCSGCHTVGGGKLVGPDLQGLAGSRDRAWVERFVRDPAAVVASGDPVAKQLVSQYGMTMPTLGVSDAQLAALLAYLGYSKAAPAPTTSTPATPAPAPALAGDAARGKRLFEGSLRFGSNGPACLSCHSVAGVGALGGGRLGPDLTGAYTKYGGTQGLGSALRTLAAFRTMVPIFTRKQLSAQERADLVAFLQSAAGKGRSSSQAGKLVGLSLGVGAALVLLALLVWHRRLPAVRRSLVDRAAGRTS